MSAPTSAQNGPLSDESAPDVPTDAGDAGRAREARYAEAIDKMYLDFSGGGAWSLAEIARLRVLPIVDAEVAAVVAQRDEARAEAERLRRDYSLAAKYRDEYRDDAHSASQALLEMIDAREAAEARYADLRKRIEALADEWARTVYKLPPGYPMTVNKFCHLRFTAPLRAVLAVEPTPPAEPDAEGGA